MCTLVRVIGCADLPVFAPQPAGDELANGVGLDSVVCCFLCVLDGIRAPIDACAGMDDGLAMAAHPAQMRGGGFAGSAVLCANGYGMRVKERMRPNNLVDRTRRSHKRLPLTMHVWAAFEKLSFVASLSAIVVDRLFGGRRAHGACQFLQVAHRQRNVGCPRTVVVGSSQVHLACTLADGIVHTHTHTGCDPRSQRCSSL